MKLGCAFTQTKVDEDGYPMREPDCSSYLANLGPCRRLRELMVAEDRRRCAGRVRELTILGEGVHGIWNLASQHFPEGTQIVDLYHAREHLHDLGKLLAFILRRTSTATGSDGGIGELDDCDIHALLGGARQFSLAGIKAEELDTALCYFEINASRMRYKRFRSCGLFVGSGVV